MVKRGREGDGRGGVVRDDMMATKNDHDNGGGGGGGGGIRPVEDQSTENEGR
jgi:hypothetical protein